MVRSSDGVVMQLSKTSGPNCPGCGCNATTLVGAGERFGRPWARYECNFCHRSFSNGAQPPATSEVVNGVVYRPVKCPKCKSKKTRVHTTRPPIRYHQCNNCGQQFKSVEEN